LYSGIWLLTGGVVVAIDGVGPLCDVVAAETMVALTVDKGKLGEASPVVATVMGMEEFPMEVTEFGSITGLGADRRS
jgi:hypothetical protein